MIDEMGNPILLDVLSIRSLDMSNIYYSRAVSPFTSRKPTNNLVIPCTDGAFPCVLLRSALDELAGRGGRGIEDNPSCLTARCLLQFLRARMKEKSLNAAPYDLLPASAVCQVTSRRGVSGSTRLMATKRQRTPETFVCDVLVRQFLSIVGKKVFPKL